MSSQYNNYFEIYDTIHSKKNYIDEVKCIEEYINMIKPFEEVEKILDFGCGTCAHLEILLKNHPSKKAVGVDICQKMIDKASDKKIKNLKLFAGDLNNLNIPDKFDLCISMFNVVNHIESHRELEKVFKNINKYLKEKGILIFDCFNGAAVYKDPPRDRKFNDEFLGKSIEYSSIVKIDYLNDSFTMKNKIKYLGRDYEYELRQKVWTIGLLKDILEKNNFVVKEIFKSFTRDKPDAEDYKICFVCKKRD